MAEVVKTHRNPQGIWTIVIEDREGRNTFTSGVVAGLFAAFGQVTADAEAHAVVLHGFDNIFLAGGTVDELIGIAERRQRFDEAGFYRLLLDCPIPVVAAMQGHALGGGFIFGLYADVIVMAREALYSANFMKYGFSPGMGSTLILPEKMGVALGEEMLLTARSYHGGTLAARGAPVTILPRGEVISAAMSIADDFADKPVEALRLLKAHLTQHRRLRLPEVVDQEVAMHDVTFGSPGIQGRIRDRWGN